MPRRLVVVGAVVAAVIVVVAVMLVGPGKITDAYRSWANRLQNEAADVSEARPGGDGAEASSGALLLAVSDENERGVAFAVLATGTDGTPVVAVVPATLYDLVPGFGEFPLGDALRFEGPELAAMVVSNTLGIDVEETAVIPASAMADLFDEPVPIELGSPLVQTQADGTVLRIASEGNLGRDGTVVAELFANQGDGDLLAHLERQAATWEGVVRHVASDADLVDRFAAYGEGVLVEELLAAVDADGLDVTLVPLSRVGGGADEGFEIDAGELSAFLERRFSHVALAEGDRPTVELLNGNGRLLSTRWVADVLIGEGYRIIRTDNAERFDFEETIVVAQGEENTEAARDVVRALGVGELRLEIAAPSGIVDVSIIVGQDVPAGEG